MYRLLFVIFIFLFGCTKDDNQGTQSISLNKTHVTVGVNEMETLSVICEPENISPNLKLVSQAASIVTTRETTKNKKYEIKGVSIGKTKVLLMSEDDNQVKAECIVTVSSTLMTGVDVVDEDGNTIPLLSLTMGQSTILRTRFYPLNTTNTNLSFKSENESIVTINEHRTVKAISPGRTNIIITSEDGGVSVKFPVTVTGIAVTGITLDKTEEQLAIGETLNLTATVSPENATNKDIIWSSSDPDIATVSDDGVVTALSEGNVRIIASSNDGDHSATCKITVTAEPEEPENYLKINTSVKYHINEQITVTFSIDMNNTSDNRIEIYGMLLLDGNTILQKKDLGYPLYEGLTKYSFDQPQIFYETNIVDVMSLIRNNYRIFVSFSVNGMEDERMIPCESEITIPFEQ